MQRPATAVRVQGRAADLLTFPTPTGHTVTIAPLAFTALLDRIPGIDQFQLVHSTPTYLVVRLRPAPGTDPDQARHLVTTEIGQLLSAHGLEHVTVTTVDEQPERTAGGKLRTVIPLGGGAGQGEPAP